MTHKSEWNKRRGLPARAAHSISELARKSKYSVATLRKVHNRGVGAHSTNPGSVRRQSDFKKAPGNKLSAEQWGMARVYAFLNKIESGAKLNHDTDLR